RWLVVIGALFCSQAGICQQYKLSYKSENIPELYNEVEVIVEKLLPGGGARIIKGGYTLKANAGKIENNKLLKFDRSLLHRNAGIIHFTLTRDQLRHELVLTLPILKEIHFNLYADSVKPVLNYYLNIEGVFNNGKIYPLDTSHVIIRANQGTVQGMEWVKPGKIDFESVRFEATYRYDSSIKAIAVAHLKKEYIEK
ncbi:MAG TPA: hypothetical protein VEB40_09540, partial [Flavipsychrobacter sp.]|nr:hypothetical protein [Flavipsychrobacter sp.]